MYETSFTENDVRMLAHHFLIKHYHRSIITGKIHAAIEAPTLKGKLADGFYAFRRTHDTVYVATLECKKDLKSGVRKTLHPKKLINAVLLFAGIANILFFIFWFRYNQLLGLYLEPLTIIFIVLLFIFLYFLSQRQYDKYSHRHSH